MKQIVRDVLAGWQRLRPDAELKWDNFGKGIFVYIDGEPEEILACYFWNIREDDLIRVEYVILSDKFPGMEFFDKRFVSEEDAEKQILTNLNAPGPIHGGEFYIRKVYNCQLFPLHHRKES